MAGLPQTKGKELLDQVLDAFKSLEPVESFTLQRLRRDIDKQLSVLRGDVGAHIASLALNVIARDKHAVRNSLTRWRMEAGHSRQLCKNGSTALIHVGCPDEAWDLLEEGRRIYGGDPHLLENATVIAFVTGRFRGAAAAIRDFRAGQGTSDRVIPVEGKLSRLLEFLERNEISEDESTAAISPMITEQAKYTHRPGDGVQTVHFYEDHGAESVVFRFGSYVPEAHVVDVVEGYLDQTIGRVPPRVRKLLSADLEASTCGYELNPW